MKNALKILLVCAAGLILYWSCDIALSQREAQVSSLNDDGFTVLTDRQKEILEQIKTQSTS